MAVKAEFIGAPVVVDLIESVYFSDLSQGNPTAWFWDFGDGETSTEQNPVHFFHTYGRYTVVLRVTDTITNDVIVKNYYITVKNNISSFGFVRGHGPSLIFD